MFFTSKRRCLWLACKDGEPVRFFFQELKITFSTPFLFCLGTRLLVSGFTAQHILLIVHLISKKKVTMICLHKMTNSVAPPAFRASLAARRPDPVLLAPDSDALTTQAPDGACVSWRFKYQWKGFIGLIILWLSNLIDNVCPHNCTTITAVKILITKTYFASEHMFLAHGSFNYYPQI